MSPEFIAIIATAAFQSSLLIIALWMSYRLGKILERMEGVNAAIFLQGRNIQDLVREMREQTERAN